MPEFLDNAWLLMCGVALIVGFAKSGVPGCGILAVPLSAKPLA